MRVHFKPALTLLAGIAIGGSVIQTIHAQAKPPTYVVVALRKINDPAAFKTEVVDKAAAAMANTGGKYVIRTDKITALDGTPPKRFIIIAFDNAQKAQDWNNSPGQKEINEIRAKTTKSRSFIVEGAQ